jgi:hypothetical protein
MITLDFEWVLGAGVGFVLAGEDDEIHWGLILMLGPLFVMLEKVKTEDE